MRNTIFGVGYAPYMFGSGPNSWYTHRLGIRLDYSSPTNEADYPFDRVPFNLNNDLLEHRDSEPYRRRVVNDIRSIASLGIQLIRFHTYPATERNLPFLKWLASVCEETHVKMMVDLLKERPEHWCQVDPKMCGIYANELKGKVAIWQIMNETNGRYAKNAEPIISSYAAAAEEIRKVDPYVPICFNNAGFNPEYTERFVEAGVPIDLFGVDYYPFDDAEEYVLGQCKLLREFHERHPRIKILIDEYGLHPRGPVKYSTSRLELHRELFDKYARIFLREIGDLLYAFIPFWFQDLLVFRTRCYHQIVNLDRTLTPLGEAYLGIIREYSSNPIRLDQVPKIHRGHLRFNRDLQPISGVGFYPSRNDVGSFLEELKSPLIVVGEGLSPSIHECGMFLAKTLSYFLPRQPEVRTDVEVKAGRGKGEPCILIGGKNTNLLLQDSDVNQIKEPRRGAVSAISLKRSRVLVINGSDDDGAVAATLDVVRRYWQTESSLSPELVFS